jgi:capsular polysaccharide biosynthesis protein
LNRTKVQNSIRAYLRSNDDSDLDQAREVLARTWAADDSRRQYSKANVKIVINGWYSKRNSGKISSDLIKSSNPDYKVKVSRRVREDLIVHWKTYGLFSAFQVTATARNSSEKPVRPFELVFNEKGKGGESLSTSNPTARKMVTKWLSPAPRSSRKAVGFIDSVIGPSEFTLELQNLVLASAEDLLHFATADDGEFICKKTAAILRANGRDEQAEKFEFLSGDSDINYRVFKEVLVQRHFIPKRRSRSRARAAVNPSIDDVVEVSVAGDRIPSPGSGWLDLRQVELHKGSLVINDGTLECYEHAADPTWDFVSGLWQVQFGSPRKKGLALIKTSKKSVESLPESILIGGRNDSNYYHFMIEYLPRILSIPSSVGKSVPILISKSVPKSGKQALQRLTDRKIIQIDPEKQYRVKRIHVSAPVAQVLDTTKIPWADGVFINTKALKDFRKRCFEVVGAQQSMSRKIFIRRESGHRSILNGAKLEIIAKKMGYEVVDVLKLSWEQQVRLFASSKVVVGAGGAIMANYVFLPKGAKVVSFTSKYLSGFSLPAYIASIAGAPFIYITGRSRITRDSKRNTQQLMHSGYRVRASTFKRVLRELAD